jgi:hypothetical protein
MSENAYLKSLLLSRENSVSMLKMLESGQLSDARLQARCASLREQIATIDAMIEAEKFRTTSSP